MDVKRLDGYCLRNVNPRGRDKRNLVSPRDEYGIDITGLYMISSPLVFVLVDLLIPTSSWLQFPIEAPGVSSFKKENTHWASYVIRTDKITASQ